MVKTSSGTVAERFSDPRETRLNTVPQVGRNDSQFRLFNNAPLVPRSLTADSLICAWLFYEA